MPKPGPLNLITDVSQVLVGHALDERAGTGVTVLRCQTPMTAAVDVRGGGPGTRETELLAPENLVDRIDAVVLSGGSVFGLAAADAVVTHLSQQGVGLRISADGPDIPIVPGAVLHDLGYPGAKDWGMNPPYFQLGQAALKAVAREFELGSVGAGRGAHAGLSSGGVGSTSMDLDGEIMVGALAVVNCIGSAVLPDGHSFYAWPYEQNGEFGDIKPASQFDLSEPFPQGSRLAEGGVIMPGASTTLAVVASSVELTSAELKRVAMMAHDGLARAVRPAHTPADGDIVFALSAATVKRPSMDALSRAMLIAKIGSACADCLTRAVARGVYAAR